MAGQRARIIHLSVPDGEDAGVAAADREIDVAWNPADDGTTDIAVADAR